MAGKFKEIRRRIWLILNIGVVLWLLLGVLSMQVPPYTFWPAGFVAFSLPGALVLNLVFLFYWILKRSWFVLLPLLTLLLGWNYYGRLFSIRFGSPSVIENAQTLHVLSYNTHMFNAYTDKDGNKTEASVEMADWVSTHPADVYCLQEFYSNRGSSIYNTISRIGKRYDKHRYFSVSNVDKNKADIGMVIFSRYPILNEGTIIFKEKSTNRVIWVDLDVNGDTVRVYAVHLQSMSIKAQDIENTYSAIGNEQKLKREGKNLARRLRMGFIARGYQVEQLLEHVKESPYPVIVAGDFNDIPFSYTYSELAKKLNNSFETAGKGIGATYNGLIPFLRIDNQFYSEGLRAVDFEVHNEMGLSDHFPISAKYVFEKE